MQFEPGMPGAPQLGAGGAMAGRGASSLGIGATDRTSTDIGAVVMTWACSAIWIVGA